MYYVDFYSLFNHPEKDWEACLKKAAESPQMPSLFDQGGLECQKENLNRIVSAIEAVFPTLFDVYRTAIKKYMLNKAYATLPFGTAIRRGIS